MSKIIHVVFLFAAVAYVAAQRTRLQHYSDHLRWMKSQSADALDMGGAIVNLTTYAESLYYEDPDAAVEYLKDQVVRHEKGLQELLNTPKTNEMYEEMISIGIAPQRIEEIRKLAHILNGLCHKMQDKVQTLRTVVEDGRKGIIVMQLKALAVLGVEIGKVNNKEWNLLMRSVQDTVKLLRNNNSIFKGKSRFPY